VVVVMNIEMYCDSIGRVVVVSCKEGNAERIFYEVCSEWCKPVLTLVVLCNKPLL